VVIYGQDVGGTFGGAFKATKGLAKEFPGRVLNAPISEDAIVGTAYGAAIEGMRRLSKCSSLIFQHRAEQILKQCRHALLRTMCRFPSRFVWPSGGTKAVGRSTVNRWIQFMRIIRGSCHDAGDGGRRVHHAHEAGAIDDPVVTASTNIFIIISRRTNCRPRALPIGRRVSLGKDAI